MSRSLLSFYKPAEVISDILINASQWAVDKPVAKNVGSTWYKSPEQIETEFWEDWSSENPWRPQIKSNDEALKSIITTLPTPSVTRSKYAEDLIMREAAKRLTKQK